MTNYDSTFGKYIEISATVDALSISSRCKQ